MMHARYPGTVTRVIDDGGFYARRDDGRMVYFGKREKQRAGNPWPGDRIMFSVYREGGGIAYGTAVVITMRPYRPAFARLMAANGKRRPYWRVLGPSFRVGVVPAGGR